MTDGPDVALAELDALDEDPRLDDHHRLHAVRAHLHELAGRDDAARREYLEAARLTRSLPERRHLQRRAQRLARPADDAHLTPPPRRSDRIQRTAASATPPEIASAAYAVTRSLSTWLEPPGFIVTP